MVQPGLGKRKFSFRLIFLTIGTRAGLAVRVSAYSPEVVCNPGQKYDDRGTCSKLISTMSTGAVSILFTRDVTVTARKIFIPPGGDRILSGT